MKDNNKKNLIIYRASAGSGKTFTLVSEYLALAIKGYLCNNNDFNDKVNSSFGKILAITFTNKATSEMKIRILNTLYDIAHNQAEENGYINKIKELLDNKFSEKEIVSSAKKVLYGILHNYDSFNIKTIDAFYQGIVNNIAILVGFNSSLEVYLDDSEAISNAVDNIINGVALVNSKKKEHYLYLLNQYIENHIEEETSWDFRRELKNFGENICREIYMMNSEKINSFFDDDTKANDYLKKIHAIKYKCEKAQIKLADTFIELMRENNVEFENIKYGNHLNKYLVDLKNGDNVNINKRINDFLTSSDSWKKSNKAYNSGIAQKIEEILFPAFKKLENCRYLLQYKINSADLTLANMNDMRMLSMIDETVKRESKDSNRILLSKSQELIKSEIRDTEDISFVFEQAGKQYSHIMLDEAQDTSHMQWDNLNNFLLNVISDINGRSVIVGDIKQSIYRWRNSDWQILAGLTDGKTEGVFKDRIEVNTLGFNFRSEVNIVNFNSQFFYTASKIMNTKAHKYCDSADYRFGDLYNDVVQQSLKKELCGYIQIDTLITNKDKNNKTPLKYHDLEKARLKILIENIESIHNNGVSYSRMAILVRKNSELTIITDYFKENEIPIKINTNEAYSVANAVSVKMIIAAIKIINGYINGIEETLCATFLAYQYQNLLLGEKFDRQLFYNCILGAKQEDNAIDSVYSYIIRMLPSCFVDEITYLSQLPISQLVMTLIDALEIKKLKNESAYIYTFLDYVDNYSQNNAYDIGKFLEDWEVEADGQKISITETDGITAMTVHSAKGLEFDTVFVPFCDWKFIPNKNSLLWCSPEEEPYNEAPLLPIEYRLKSAESIYANDYYKENFNILVDNLNMLYVAFTRAKTNLMVEIAEPSFVDKISNERISNVITETLNDESFNKCLKMSTKKIEMDDDVNLVRKSYGKISPINSEQVILNKVEHFSMIGKNIDVAFN